MPEHTCQTCHWWFRFAKHKAGWGDCVWHTGMRGKGPAATVKITFGGKRITRTLSTRQDFGCNSWQKDERVKDA